MLALHWFARYSEIVILSGVLVVLGVVLIALLRSSASRESAFFGCVPTDYVPAPVHTWSDDFGAWKHGDITLDEFLDRRWSFRNLR
jgi:hypothetical protein